MSPDRTAREALIVEALGNIGAMLDRVDALIPALAAGREALAGASALLSLKLETFDAHMNAITENAKIKTMQHVAQRTDEMARRSVRDLRENAHLMADAARSALQAEIRQALEQFIQRHQQPKPRWWHGILTNAAISAAASGYTWVAMMYFGCR